MNKNLEEEIKIEILNPKVEDILTKYYKEKGKDFYLQEDLKTLYDQRIYYVSDWKDLSQDLK